MLFLHDDAAPALPRALPRDVRAAWRTLSEVKPRGTFDPACTDGLPAPARRYLRRSIRPGSPLFLSVALTMTGSMRLKPGGPLFAMTAEQVLAPPHGLVWCATVQRGALRISGYDRYFDGQGAMRWKLYGALPVASARGPDVTRSAAGRVAGEAVFVPASLLPQFGTEWEDIDDTIAAYRMRVGDETARCEVHVDDEGRLLRASIRRWREAADGRPAGYHRFDVDQWSDERTFDGYTLPTRFRAGWGLGDEGEFGFFEATIGSVAFRG